MAMYAAKLVTGTAYLHFTEPMDQRSGEQAGLGTDRHQALERTGCSSSISPWSRSTAAQAANAAPRY
jgi:hypothetical protein